MPFKTRITEMLGIKHPIIQGGMMFVGRAELAAAVSNAGGLGIITALTQPTANDLRAEIRRCKQLTKNPFGVNLTFLPSLRAPPYEEYIAVIIEEGITVIETAGRSPSEHMPTLLKAGIKVIHKCTSVRHAQTAERLGCAAISMDGWECAGHPGEDDLPLFILLAKGARVLKIPMVASGGIGDGKGLAAALALGAEGINMGTRFLCTKEAPVHENMKRAIVSLDERSTTHIFRKLRNTERVVTNSVAKEVQRIEAEPGKPDFAKLAPLVNGQRARAVFEDGDMEGGIWTAGPVMGIIDDVPTCKELIDRIVAEAEEIVGKRLNGMLSIPGGAGACKL
eukprot:TRINITY_DN5518_c0_g1_i1.p1 TRINITY_DN5518_c0_g1~~TRINITY_DN5518_c0_g1_i1.p1  ORF type:complete len:344 (+),score=67.80 TRINITY_DN5518_c0_g1_i1:24-1034(+)